jgi:hypothetical protein
MSNCADTEESTPPDIPTVTFCFICGVLTLRLADRVTVATPVYVEALHYLSLLMILTYKKSSRIFVELS